MRLCLGGTGVGCSNICVDMISTKRRIPNIPHLLKKLLPIHDSSLPPNNIEAIILQARMPRIQLYQTAKLKFLVAAVVVITVWILHRLNQMNR